MDGYRWIIQEYEGEGKTASLDTLHGFINGMVTQVRYLVAACKDGMERNIKGEQKIEAVKNYKKANLMVDEIKRIIDDEFTPMVGSIEPEGKAHWIDHLKAGINEWTEVKEWLSKVDTEQQ